MWRRKITFKRIAVGIFLALVALIAFNFNKSKYISSVKLAQVEQKVVDKTLSADGTLASEKEASLSFTSLGTLEKLNVSEGDYVTKGTLIATLDTTQAYYDMQALKDTRDIALRDRDIYVLTYEDNKDTVGGDDIYDEQLRRLTEILSKAEAGYQAALNAVADRYMYAPFDGVIVKSNFNQGETVTATSEIVKLADIKDLYFEITVDQTDFVYLVNNMQAKVTLDSYDNYEFTGHIYDLPSYINVNSDENITVKVKLSPDESKNIPMYGMTGEAALVLETTDKEVTALAYDVINYDEENKPYVWIVNTKNKIEKKYIEIGIEGDIYTEVKTDIKEKIVIPVNAQAKVQEGYTAVIINE